ncbi:hypothetical protein [Pilimelia columellifera]|uniref:Uncharacterized protein n=1 Tax=Pilimelia columellifera subsp. columellifera TaxID=706583 RepID=A0ABP6AA73_9ACTN
MASFRGTGSLILSDGATVPVTVDLRSRTDGTVRVWGGHITAVDDLTAAALTRNIGNVITLTLDIGEQGQVLIRQLDNGAAEVAGAGPAPF